MVTTACATSAGRSLGGGESALELLPAGQIGPADRAAREMRAQLDIRRFGRFPHRNAALGRISTPDELAAFVKTELVKYAKIVKDSGARVD